MITAVRTPAGAPGPMPEALAGFEHVTRYWDSLHESFAAKILPGEFYVTYHPELVVTVLGSCVSACVRDPLRGFGGMNHFMLPAQAEDSASDWSADLSTTTRYGNFAMERLLNELLKRGSVRRNLEVKIFGGGQVLAGMTDIGRLNVAFVREYLAAEGLRVVAEDVEDVYPRKVYYFPRTGRVRVLKLKKLANDTIVRRERDYMFELAAPIAGAVELF